MNEIQQAAQAIVRADALLIGASNGLSIAEGYHVFANNGDVPLPVWGFPTAVWHTECH